MDSGPVASGRQLPTKAHPGMTKGGQTRKKPAVISDGRPIFRHAASSAAATDATLTEVEWTEEAQNALRDDLGGDAADAGTAQADRAGGARGQVKHPAADERAAVVDGDDEAAGAMGHPELGTERQRTVGRRQGALIETLARGGLAAGFVAVKGSHPGEAASGAR